MQKLIPYFLARVLGGLLVAAILFLIASGKPVFEVRRFAANGYGEHSAAVVCSQSLFAK